MGGFQSQEFQKKACDGRGMSGLQSYCDHVAMLWLFTEGQIKHREDNTHNPQLIVASDHRTPLNPLINVHPLVLSAPLWIRAALFYICLCEQLHYSPKLSHSVTHSHTVCV